MATRKSRESLPCFIHCVAYTVPFLILTSSYYAIGFIFGTHFLIDRFGLARYLVWLKNWMSPDGYPRFKWCSKTGYYDHDQAQHSLQRECTKVADAVEVKTLADDHDICKPVWIRVWLFIIADNTLHLACNAWALWYWKG